MAEDKIPPAQGDNPTDKSEPEQPKHAGGRPLKFETVEKLDVAIQAYFDTCDPHVEQRLVDGGVNQKGETIWLQRGVLTEQQPYTVSGLARALGVTRDTLINYRERDEFFDSIHAGYERCHEYAESQLYGRSANGASFSLKNNWGWHDKQEIDHTSKGMPMPLLGGTTPLLNEEESDEPTTTET